MSVNVASTGDMTPLEHALYYASRGWRVIPIPPGHKHPAGIDRWQEKATTDDRRIRKYWGSNPSHGMGIATGPESGLFVIDVDPDDGGDDSLAVLEARHGQLPDTIEAITGGGGRHLLFAWPEGAAIHNSASGVLGVGIDVRGIGGQIVVAPSIHPTTGNAYAWEIEHDPFDGCAPAPAPQWLIDALTSAPGDAQPRREPIVRDPNSDLPGDVWARSTTWADELQRDGWSLHSTHADLEGHPYEMWTRPGKDVREGASASLYYRGSDVLKVFTSNASPLNVNETYSLWGYHVATRHGGDFAAAARAQRATMMASTPASAPAPPSAAQQPAGEPEVIEDDDWATIEVIEDDDWATIELHDLAAAFMAGDYEPIMPTVLMVTGSIALFYPARVNSLFGESGGGKTWVALAAVAEVVRRGGRVLFVDYEDNPQGIVERLVLLGLTLAEIVLVDYRNPTSGIGRGLECVEGPYGLIVVDSTGEAMAAGSVDPNSDGEVAQWFTIAKRYARLDGAPPIVVLDHVPKDKDAPTSYAIGSQRKRAALNGAAYRVDTLKEPAKGRDGKLKLTVAKDRLGNRPKGSVAAEVDVISGAESVRLELHLSDAQAAAESGAKFRPTVLMERVSKYLEAAPLPLTQRNIERGVTGKAQGIRMALECLAEEGFVVTDKAGHRSIKPYREAVDNSSIACRVPASPARPSASRDAAEEGASPRPRDSMNGDAGRASEGEDAPSTHASASPVDNSSSDADGMEHF